MMSVPFISFVFLCCIILSLQNRIKTDIKLMTEAEIILTEHIGPLNKTIVKLHKLVYETRDRQDTQDKKISKNSDRISKNGVATTKNTETLNSFFAHLKTDIGALRENMGGRLTDMTNSLAGQQDLFRHVMAGKMSEIDGRITDLNINLSSRMDSMQKELNDLKTDMKEIKKNLIDILDMLQKPKMTY